MNPKTENPDITETRNTPEVTAIRGLRDLMLLRAKQIDNIPLTIGEVELHRLFMTQVQDAINTLAGTIDAWANKVEPETPANFAPAVAMVGALLNQAGGMAQVKRRPDSPDDMPVDKMLDSALAVHAENAELMMELLGQIMTNAITKHTARMLDLDTEVVSKRLSEIAERKRNSVDSADSLLAMLEGMLNDEIANRKARRDTGQSGGSA